ncbi:MAG: baseplate J/gp47 family protein [Acetobacteraceae bacterium]|nr:baseplate J/gp47 family protein [Acetobacteraceae bacterium]
MKLNLQTFSTIVANSAAAVQAGTAQLLDLSTGSLLRAILEANASITLWLQWLVICVMRIMRASTSAGSDLDSWMGDFGFTRLPSSCAFGVVTFSRYNVSNNATIAPDALVRTADGTQTFSVSTDAANVAWNTALGAYVLASGVTSIDLPVVATVAGVAGNVQAGAITTIASPIAGVDMVANALGATNGRDAEQDAAFRSRFVLFINSRSQATRIAVEYAISCVQQGLSYSIQENLDGSGNSRNGSFLVTVDDGSGCPSATLLSAVNSAIDVVRPIGSVFTIQPPTVQLVAVSANVTLTANANQSAVLAAIETQITNFVNNLPVGVGLPITRVAQLAYDADPSVINVRNLVLNGNSLDIAVSVVGIIKLSNLSVTL